MKSALITSSLYSILFLLNFFLAEKVRKHFSKFQEFSRKVVHISSGLIALSFPYFIHSHFVVLGLVLVFSLLMWMTKRKHLLPSIHEVGRKSHGSLYYPLAIYLIFLLASDTPVIYFTSILVMTVSDAFAALVGKRYGTIQFEVEGTTKSLEGSLSFLFLTFLCVLIPLLLMSQIGRVEVLLIALIMSILLTGFEAISPTGSDNIIIPFGTYFLITKMAKLPLPLLLEDVYILMGTIAVTALLSPLLKPTGLIGIMLLNYASFTLGNIYWTIPLVMTEFFLFLLVSFAAKQQEKFPIRVLFYLGIIPTSLLFAANAFPKSSFLFLPYLISILAQIPLSYVYHVGRTKKYTDLHGNIQVRETPSEFAYRSGLHPPTTEPQALPLEPVYSPLQANLQAGFSMISIAICSLWLFYGTFDLKQFITTCICSFLICLFNYLIHKKAQIETIDPDEYRVRAISTLLGVACFFTIHLGGSVV